MTEQTYNIGNMDCAGCAREVENGVRRLDGVKSVRVDFASSKMHLDGDVPFTLLDERVRALGKTISTEADTPSQDTPSVGGVVGFWHYLTNRRETQLALTGGGLVLVVLILSLLVSVPSVVTNVGYAIGMMVALYPILKSGINALRINREFNINLLMSIAALGALVIGEYLEGATVIFLFAIGEALEGYTSERARSSIRSLMSLKPKQATRLDGEQETVVAVEDLRVGDTILVKPGENLPMDGVVKAGASSINQAPITGESVPVNKAQGDEVYAGSINGAGTLEIEVTRLAKDNTLSRIIQLVEEAQSVRAPSQRMIDRFAHYYTPAVTVLALLVATVPPLVFGAPFFDTATGHGWLYRALAMLVIACPCALVISTPVTVISAITAAARRGVLIKGGAHLEALGTAQVVAFDKTGTLTTGQPTVTAFRSVDCADGEPCERCDDVLALASAVESRTSHPLAQAVVHEAETQQVQNVYPAAQSVEMLSGRGVTGDVGGRKVTIGSHRLFDESFPHQPDLCEEVRAAEASGQTTVLVAEDDNVRGYITLSDTARDTSRDVVKTLNAMNLQTVMLTGDNTRVAQSIGEAVGVTDIRAGLLPEDKVNAVRDLLLQHGSVLMVGDGINDTPALAAATVGVAMGGAGSPQALETADVALMADDLTQLPFAVRLSRFARRLIQSNIVLSIGIKLVFLGLALFGATSLWLAILADVGMSLAVTLNGMRPLRFEGQHE